MSSAGEKPISVLMSVYNEASFVGSAVESILSQTFDEFEFVIVDDASTDGTSAILRDFDDPRIVLIENDENIGFVRSLNRGLDECSGKYVARMDGDDVSKSHRLETQLRYLESLPETGIVGSFYWKVVESNGEKKIVRPPVTDPEIRFSLLLWSPFAHSTVMFDRTLLEKHDLRYSPHYPVCEDYDLWSRLLKHTRAGNVPEPLVEYRVHDDNTSRQNKRDVLRDHDKIALRTIRDHTPSFETTQKEVSQLRLVATRDDAFSPYDIDENRPELAGRYLDLFEAFEERHRDSTGMSKLRRSTVEKTLRILVDDRRTKSDQLAAIANPTSTAVIVRAFRVCPRAVIGVGISWL